MGALFVLLAIGTSFWTLVASPGMALHPRNARLQRIENFVVRGSIYSYNGIPMASSDAPLQRKYTVSPTLAHTTGYVHPRFGKSGLELAYDKELLGMLDETAGRRFWAEITGQTWAGWDVMTTLDMVLQSIVEEAMAERTGAVVVMDPRDGAIRALYSAPGFYPDQVEDWFDAKADDDPLFNRATLGQYPPGSVFKPIILATALESDIVKPDAIFEDLGSVRIGGRNIVNAGGVAHGELALDDALAVSSNTVFAQLAVKIGEDRLVSFAQRMGLGVRPDLPVPATMGNVPKGKGQADVAALAALGIGQGDLLVSPLQMAVAISAIANGGWQVRPYLVDHLRSPTDEVRSIGSKAGARVMTPGSAHVVREAMITSVERGTGTAARVAELVVAGKTGTAEVRHGDSHAWFVGFAPARSPRLVVVVLIEHGGAGGTAAAPIAKQIFSRVADLM